MATKAKKKSKLKAYRWIVDFEAVDDEDAIGNILEGIDEAKSEVLWEVIKDPRMGESFRVIELQGP